ncbi:hypothetical protein [Ochrobactrum chromiisoli]|uniref:SMODS and SLOG-associating 2TM effector domain-containing protein n=1 Tax=Ochrobactrum chromiisoli TaxID=2993941 RepID=A0ABT3QLB4_9HYPH|nr:hypothetical protein [Ochrobactrum chromiisoli]MCX2696412.1 hypothetical protein [Ochrobactrum chromiisoli]
MPKISGRDVLTDTTEKSQVKLFLVTSITILAKAYELPINDFKLLGMDFPSAIVDVSLLALTLWYTYSYLIKWLGDLISFRLWYSQSAITTNFGTELKINSDFIWGGIKALKEFNNFYMKSSDFQSLDEDNKRLHRDFVTNVELYSVRLEHAGKKFTAISLFGFFYVWIQGFIIPVIMSVAAIYMMVKYGAFTPPYRY